MKLCPKCAYVFTCRYANTDVTNCDKYEHTRLSREEYERQIDLKKTSKGDVRRLMLNKRQIEQLARNSSIKGIRYYMQRVHEDVDILSGEEKRQILEEMEKIIEEIKIRDKRNREDISRYMGGR